MWSCFNLINFNTIFLIIISILTKNNDLRKSFEQVSTLSNILHPKLQHAL